MAADKCPLCHRSNKQRSTQQNKVQWGLAYPPLAARFTELTGDEWTEKEVHEWVKKEYAGIIEKYRIDEPERVVTVNGELRTINKAPSTAKLTTEGSNILFATLQRFGAGIGVDIPAPNEIPFEQIREV